MDRLPDTDKLSHHISDMLRNDKAPIGIISSNFFLKRAIFLLKSLPANMMFKVI